MPHWPGLVPKQSENQQSQQEIRPPETRDRLYDALFNPTTGAVANELRQPLPSRLKEVQRKAFADYLAYQAKIST